MKTTILTTLMLWSGVALAQTPPLPPLPPLPPMGQAEGKPTTVQLNVKGPITLRTDLMTTDLEIAKGAAGLVKASLIDADAGTGVRLSDHGDRVDLIVERTDCGPRGKGCVHGGGGRLLVQIPAGSRVEASVLSGDVSVLDVGGDVHLRATSGDVKVKVASAVEAMLVSGEAHLAEVRGPIRLRTVSGDAHIEQNAGAPSQLEFGTTSGDLDWRGACGTGCRIEARSLSGDVRLSLAKASSFDLNYVSHSGELADGLKLSLLNQVENRSGGGAVHARLGKGEGIVEVQTFSGELTLAPNK
jgi:hypothetical protein